jgi:hypothetical protein
MPNDPSQLPSERDGSPPPHARPSRAATEARYLSTAEAGRLSGHFFGLFSEDRAGGPPQNAAPMMVTMWPALILPSRPV